MTKRRDSTSAIAEQPSDPDQTRSQRKARYFNENQADDQRPLRPYRSRTPIDRDRKRRPPGQPREDAELRDRTKARPKIFSIPGRSRTRF